MDAITEQEDGHYLVGGAIAADGKLVGIRFRWGLPTDGKSFPWIVGAINLAPSRSIRIPVGKQNEILVAQEDAPKLGISGTLNEAVLRELEVHCNDGRLMNVTATIRGIHREEGAISTVLVDPLMGRLNVNGQAGNWTWSVPEPE